MRIVGIDAGGTKTDFLLCDENENVINRVTLGSGNPNDIGIEALLSLLDEGLDALCGEDAPDALFAGVSGGGFGNNFLKIREFLEAKYRSAVVDNGSDALNLLSCSNYDDGVGALICGTGSVIFVQDEGGLTRYGGWGHLFDNGGSGYDIGRDALRLLLDAEERGEELLTSPLFSLLLDKLGDSAHNSIQRLYSSQKAYIASFAPIVFEAFEQSDARAFSIINSNVDAVASRVSHVISNHPSVKEFVCAGGLFKSKIFFDLLSLRVSVPLVVPDFPPAFGAVRRAIRMMK